MSDHEDEWWLRVADLIDDERLDEAHAALEECIDSEGHSAIWAALKARTFMEEGLISQARRVLREQDFEDEFFRGQQLRAAALGGDPGEVRAASKLAKAYPELVAKVDEYLARCYLEVQRPRPVLRLLKNRRLTPECDSGSLTFATNALTMAGRFAEAEGIARSALKANPDSESAKWALAAAYAKQPTRKDDAVLIAGALLEPTPISWSTMYNAARLFLLVGDLPRSLELCDGLVQRRPHYIWALRLRARVHFLMGNCDGALRDFRAALKSDPRNVATFGLLLVNLLRCGRKWEALRFIFEAYRDAKRDPALFSRRTRVGKRVSLIGDH